MYKFDIGDKVKLTEKRINDLEEKQLLLPNEDNKTFHITKRYKKNNYIFYFVKENDVNYLEEELKKAKNNIKKL